MIRRTFLSAVTVCVLFVCVAGASAGQAPDAGLSFLDDFTLVVLDTKDIASLHAARNLIQAHGGRIAVMSPPSLLMGWVPPDIRDEVIGKAGIRDMYYTEVLPGEIEASSAYTRAAVNTFNAVIRGDIQRRHMRIQEAAAAAGEVAPLGAQGDVRERPLFDEASYVDNLKGAGMDPRQLADRGFFQPGATAIGNSDFMTGTAAVTLIFMESDGSGADPDMYTWTNEDMQSYIDGVITGMAFWASRAPLYTGCSVTFLVYWYSAADPRCQQWVEPILHGASAYEDTWVTNIMDNFGFTSGNRWSRVDAFNTYHRTTFNVDRAYTAFIAYNPPPVAGSFPDGSTAYAYRTGPYTVLCFRVVGWSTEQVFAHESGHIFGACDEYSGGCGSCGHCWNGIDNGNCEACNPQSTACMMKANTFNLCSFTPGQVGWGVPVVNDPCTPSPPPSGPAPTAGVSYPAGHRQGLRTAMTIGGTNFRDGVMVDFGPDVFVHLVTRVSAESLTVDFTPLNDAMLGLHDAEITNSDGTSVVFSGALDVLPTRRHYYSPAGANVFPYITPGDAATSLEDALAAGFRGDTVFVASETFVNFSLSIEEGVLLHGGWSADFTSRDLVSGKTVLQLNGNVAIFPGADEAGLDGFILDGGTGDFSTVPMNGYYGGGVVVNGADITIANCEIRNCEASNGLALGVGGAIYADGSIVDIRDNVIENNEATWGGAIYLSNCSGEISGNTIQNNVVITTTQQPQGAGVYLKDCADVSFSGNTINHNLGAQEGGGVLSQGTTNLSFSGDVLSYNAASFRGGGVAVSGGDVVFDGVDFTRNNSIIGVGVATDSADVTVSESRFLWNTGTVGGGIYATNGLADVGHSLFVGNTTVSNGGAVLLSNVSSGGLYGNTIDRNTAAVNLSSASIEIFNNLVTNTTGDAVSCTGGLETLLYNNVWGSSGSDYTGCAAGLGSISADPLYADTASVDYHLTLHSPAIDTGRPGASYEDPDGSRGDMGWYGSHSFVMEHPSAPTELTAYLEEGNVILEWAANPEGDVVSYAIYCDTVGGFVPSLDNYVTSTANTTADMGAFSDTTFYVISAVDTAGYASGYSNETNVDPATGARDEAVPRYANRLHQNVPNPFNPRTHIHYELAEATRVQLVVYDVAGRIVRRLYDGERAAGEHTAVWDGRNDAGRRVSSGIYLYQLRARGFAWTRKMLMLK